MLPDPRTVQVELLQRRALRGQISTVEYTIGQVDTIHVTVEIYSAFDYKRGTSPASQVLALMPPHLPHNGYRRPC